MKHLVIYNKSYTSRTHKEKIIFYQWYWDLPKKKEYVREGNINELHVDTEAAWERLIPKLEF